jgi:hypothetical protein
MVLLPNRIEAVVDAERQTTDEIYGLVRQAIINKDVVVASYRGYVREMCPHVIGKKNNHAQSLLYQFAGRSRSGLNTDGSPDNWRCLRIDELTEVSIRRSAGEWHSASNYSIKQTCVAEIDVRVDVE